ncbi:MAG: S1 RNA-binding domain-containing protein, partial [Clostridiales bacterium]|nr:S1 RNA-binding domain-containing protein [Clostridiales bacterium]
SGGKTIKKIIETTGVQIDVEEDGTVNVLSSDAEACNQAVEMIQNIVKDPEVGEIYTGKVVRIMDFGAFVNILPGKDGLVHISQLDKKRVNKVEDVVKVGDEVTVKVIEIDRMGRINLSRKALLD